MQIKTPENIYAQFFMKNDSLSEIDSMPRISPEQIHGDTIIQINDDNAVNYILPERPKADGLLLTTSKVSASMRYADCAPVMIYGEKWLMLLHSGFKGTVLNISGKGLALVKELYGHDEMKKSCAWIGPCIARDDYERDLREEWSIKGMNEFHRENFDVRDEKIYFDLAGEIKTQLLECGLDEKNITLSGINTYTNPECYSYRRGDIHERMTLYAKII
ncbi:MAG: polyphenol oxidase family protein [Synergistaceae bacterium]|nr:polyphenol oxidase family protein [Synergistaceae bacterium]MBR0069790.1 polyphenol oxidase family protein [Synergistaceae bacterium]